MHALGCRKLYQLMAAMLEVCPRGAERCILFPCLFLCRLPRQLRVPLARVDLADLKGWLSRPMSSGLITRQRIWWLLSSSLSWRKSPRPLSLPSMTHLSGGKDPHWKKKEAGSRPIRSPLSPVRLMWRLASAWFTGGMATQPIAATPRVRGQETKGPGACQRHSSWPSSSSQR
jgi:hypothetical protein